MLAWVLSSARHTRRHGGAYRGSAPPNDCLCPPTKIVPPKQGLCPEEISRLGAAGVQIEAQTGVCHTGIFVNFVD